MNPFTRYALITELRMAPAAHHTYLENAHESVQWRLKLIIRLRPSRATSIQPRVVTTGGDAQHSAHRDHLVMRLIRSHELEDFLGIEPVSRANQAAAFLGSRALHAAGDSLAEPPELLSLICGQIVFAPALV